MGDAGKPTGVMPQGRAGPEAPTTAADSHQFCSGVKADPPSGEDALGGNDHPKTVLAARSAAQRELRETRTVQ
eukprot:CAMPEP_0204406752 /NCGR_PEP_ID=MMETSP0470-20130426/8283_1 /ASSEMBLY_ACC=CAM_ASM_000385 /TAXON_ID=2969 /ORGANISM="Oxyrrhis marina" /LENGTH=72 /DNA_ID=CAMNT_0051402351 /DNA_START=481 /DNA_END=697 /DNA_ORIENTATION=+